MTSALMFSTVTAQAQPVDRSGSARAAMEKLRPLAGEWEMAVSSWRDGVWSEPEIERTRISYFLNDLALRREVPEHSPTNVKMETTIQFDQYRNVYRMAALDDSWGNMDIYEGQETETGTFVFDNIRTGTFAVGPQGEVFSFQLTIEIEDMNSHAMLVEISTDNGKTWAPFQRLERTRLGT
ncbi:MAG: hypothetical protein AAFY84_05990 [Pseudomonadota bacterium]